eukprot:SAG11_NODE_1255_length_5375_cov_2.966641_4_plen_183_part_00
MFHLWWAERRAGEARTALLHNLRHDAFLLRPGARGPTDCALLTGYCPPTLTLRSLQGVMLPEAVRKLCVQTWVQVEAASAVGRDGKEIPWAEARWPSGSDAATLQRPQAKLSRLYATKPTDIAAMMMHRVSAGMQFQMVQVGIWLHQAAVAWHGCNGKWELCWLVLTMPRAFGRRRPSCRRG